jgi:hypothetical protein
MEDHFLVWDTPDFPGASFGRATPQAIGLVVRGRGQGAPCHEFALGAGHMLKG